MGWIPRTRATSLGNKYIKEKGLATSTGCESLLARKEGFELSPWSTHGYLSGVKDKKQAEVNAEARANFEKEMQKCKDYYRKYQIFTIIYTDSDLLDMDQIFEEMERYLRPERENRQLLDATLEEFAQFHV